MQNVTIGRAHRVKPNQNKKMTGKASARRIVRKLQNYKDKARALRKCNHLKCTSYYIHEGFSKENLALHKDLRKEVKTL